MDRRTTLRTFVIASSAAAILAALGFAACTSIDGDEDPRVGLRPIGAGTPVNQTHQADPTEAPAEPLVEDEPAAPSEPDIPDPVDPDPVDPKPNPAIPPGPGGLVDPGHDPGPDPTPAAIDDLAACPDSGCEPTPEPTPFVPGGFTFPQPTATPSPGGFGFVGN